MNATPEPPLTCFVIMPSGSHQEYKEGEQESKFIYKHVIENGIRQASEYLGRVVQPIIEIVYALPGSVTKSIIHHLATSDFVIADITGRNPNVFLELGIRYALCPSKNILLRQGNAEIPFDIGNFKVISYEKFMPEVGAALIAEYMNNCQTNPVVDSPVFDAIPKLEVYGQGIKTYDAIAKESFVMMSWGEIMERLNSLNFYEEHFNSGTFTPDAIIGISNGGLIMAEIISRKYFKKVPLIALWADRWSSHGLKDASSHYFTNEFARNAIEPLRKMLEEKKYLTLLLIDDNVASGTTCQFAVRFLRDELGQDTRIVFQPMVCKSPEYLSAIEEVMPYSFNNNLFKLDRETLLKRIITDKVRFPYDKDIRG